MWVSSVSYLLPYSFPSSLAPLQCSLTRSPQLHSPLPNLISPGVPQSEFLLARYPVGSHRLDIILNSNDGFSETFSHHFEVEPPRTSSFQQGMLTSSSLSYDWMCVIINCSFLVSLSFVSSWATWVWVYISTYRVWFERVLHLKQRFQWTQSGMLPGLWRCASGSM